MKLLNNTARAIVFGGTLLVPATPCDADYKQADLKKEYPAIGTLIDNGSISVLSADEAAQATEDLNAKTLDQLKAIAAEKKIDISKLTKKEDIVAALEK